MKFSQTIALNSNPDWVGHYVDYAGLKKRINELSANARQKGDDAGQFPAEIFLKELEKDMKSIRDFYYEKRQEMDRALAQLQENIMLDMEAEVTERTEKINFTDDDEEYNVGATYEEPTKDDATESTPMLTPKMNKKMKRKIRSVNRFDSLMLEDLQREICDLYTQYHNLQLFGFLNVTGVTKILKKYDKIMGDDLKKTRLASIVQELWPFWVDHLTSKENEDTTHVTTYVGDDKLQQNLKTLQTYFAHFLCQGDMDLAEKRMQLLVREYISFQRHSVWLDVIQQGRKQDAAQAANTMATPGPHLPTKPQSFLVRITSSSSCYRGIASVAIFLAFLFMPQRFFSDNSSQKEDDQDEELYTVRQNALALLVFVSLLWAAEVLPLFCTALLVPFLAVVLRVIVVDGVRLSAAKTSKYVFDAMFSHVILLLLGGFSIAAALSKHGIAKFVASYITQHVLSGGAAGMRIVLLVYQFIATIASMWISNVAAPVLCYSLMAPIFKAAMAETSRVSFGAAQWKSEQNDRALCRALVMGIALSSNIGGMASPISSPQNLFAIEYTPIGWIPWFVVSVPLCIALNLLIWVWLVYCYKLPANTNSMAVAWALQRDKSFLNDPWTEEQFFVVGVSVGVVLLWCASVSLAPITGQMGVLGIIPLVLFFGTGVLDMQDLNSFLWSVVLLAMGGLVLGEAVTSSGLLEVIGQAIARVIQENELSLWQTMTIFTALILVCTTFVSHTVGAIVILPICNAVGSHMLPMGHAKELVFAGALACSAAMGLPVSGFPNMTAVGIEDHLGNRFLTTKDFLQIALPASIFAWMVLVTFGYGLITIAVDLDRA